jgi:hypothetical protein
MNAWAQESPKLQLRFKRYKSLKIRVLNEFKEIETGIYT